MSRRRKHVRDLVDEPCPELAVCEAVCRVVELRGGNHIEVEKPDRSRTLCRIPSKFSKILWVRAGSFIVARFEEGALDASSHDAKVTGEMTRALYSTQMKEMRRTNRWPALFAETETERVERVVDAPDGDDDASGDGDASDDSLPPIEVIRNRPRRAREESSSDGDSGDEEEPE